MSSDEEYVDDENEEEEGSGVDGDSDEITEDNFIASDDESCDDGNESYEPEDSDEEDQNINQRRTRGASRKCAAKTNEKMKSVIQKDNMTEREALGGLVGRLTAELARRDDIEAGLPPVGLCGRVELPCCRIEVTWRALSSSASSSRP